MKRRGLVGAGLLAAALCLAACKEKPKASPPAPSASVAAAAAPSASASAAPAKPKAPWFVGTWSGSYESQHYLIEMSKKQGGVKAWADDPGEAGAGDGKLTLTINEDRQVTGTSQGALGDLLAAGELDGDRLRVALSPRDPRGQEPSASYSGTLIAMRRGDALEGRIQASSGDSKTVRDAPVELTKGGTAAEPTTAKANPDTQPPGTRPAASSQ
jgi:hypothetical protein